MQKNDGKKPYTPLCFEVGLLGEQDVICSSTEIGVSWMTTNSKWNALGDGFVDY